VQPANNLSDIDDVDFMEQGKKPVARKLRIDG